MSMTIVKEQEIASTFGFLSFFVLFPGTSSTEN